MKTQILGCCGRYIQGYGEIRNLKKYVDWMGENFLVIASKNRLRDLQGRITIALEGKNVTFVQFDKQITWEQIHHIEDVARKAKACTILGVGGGKIADTAKVVAHDIGAHVVIIPTVSASDASTSATSLVYNDDGTIADVICFPKSPDIVLADTEILINAPVRLFVSGMGDALSTYVGGAVCQAHYFDNHFGGVGTATALAVAKLSYDMLFQYGRQAKKAAEQKVLTDAFNIITEVNILMSGMGFENNGSASDHCFYFGTLALTNRPEYVYHGEGVAFSTCCQLVMQGASNEQLDQVYRFCRDVGLPITFDDMHLRGLTDEEYDTMTRAVLKEAFIHHHPFPVTYELVLGAYKTADAIGHMYHEGGTLL
ncbi:glycerol dehydrogenase [Petroclostridium sp. X23]|uniref:glycerol dehydrogenase n=1 Tax=Petroclostridium sp. X23 TaxID=3045146 RepID=UPI0024ACA0E5|nr:glycerol dehydrogenase [Petroclostridium sp. X23]WHH57167.1 glycerol dehydrogenase [Petroclostridium sp. X23]